MSAPVAVCNGGRDHVEKRASLTRGLCHLANVAAATAAALVRGSSGGRRGHRLRGSSRERTELSAQRRVSCGDRGSQKPRGSCRDTVRATRG